MKLWIDDVRPAPEGYVWLKSTSETIVFIVNHEEDLDGNLLIELIDIDHDAGAYYQHGGDYINILDWLEETGRNYPIRIHSANPVGVQNMRRVIQRNNWKEVF